MKAKFYQRGNNVTKTEEWKSYTAAYIDESFFNSTTLRRKNIFILSGKLNRQSKADVDEFLNGYTAFFGDAILNKGKYIRDFSKGNQFKIGIVAALINNPELLILDEPFANLDPTTQAKTCRYD
jgi:ABC-2 type transport system ATP-binding protein